MQIVNMRIDAIRPYPGNPRVNDVAVDAVAESIRLFGFRQPIVVDRDMVIVVGHTRWKAAVKIGLAEVPVHVAADLTPEQARAYRIADNATQDRASWDDVKLVQELLGIRESGIDLASLGFEPGALDRILATPNFRPEQNEPPRLDERSPITCPHCGKEFIPK